MSLITLKEIAERIGVSKSAAWANLKSAGIKMALKPMPTGRGTQKVATLPREKGEAFIAEQKKFRKEAKKNAEAAKAS